MSDLLEPDAKLNVIKGPASKAGRAFDASVEPTKAGQRRKRAASKPDSGAPIVSAGGNVQAPQAPRASEATQSPTVSPEKVLKRHRRVKTDKSEGEPKQGGPERQQARPSMLGPSGDQNVPPIPDSRYWAKNYPTRDDYKRASARNLAIAAAVTFALGGVLYASWPSEPPRVFSSDTTPPLSAEAEQAASAALGMENAQQIQEVPDAIADADANSGAGAGLSADEKSAMASDLRAASSSLRQWFASTGVITDKVALPQDAGKITSSAPAESLPAPAPPETSATAAQQAPTLDQVRGAAMSAKAPETQARTLGSGAASAAGISDIVLAPPINTVARANAGSVVTAQSVGTIVSIPAKWISGGPSDSDNRRGQYRGTVVVQFSIQPEGRIANCTAVRSSGDAQLDALTCRIVMERARFTPARDAQGRSIATRAYASYFWGRGRRPKN